MQAESAQICIKKWSKTIAVLHSILILSLKYFFLASHRFFVQLLLRRTLILYGILFSIAQSAALLHTLFHLHQNYHTENVKRKHTHLYIPVQKSDLLF